VDTGSRKENASKQQSGAPFRFHRNGNGSRSEAARFTALHVPIAFAACILQWFGDRVFMNAEFDLIIALAIAIGVTCASLGSSPFARYQSASALKIGAVSLLLLRLVASDRQEPLLIAFDPRFAEQFSAREQIVRREATEVAAIEDDVYCPVKTVCRLAGKRFVVDDFKVEQMVAAKLVTQDDLDQLMALRHITTFKSDPALAQLIDSSLSRALRDSRR